jgi:hypothetical protein
VVATSKISSYPFSPERKSQLESIEQGTDWDADLGPILEQAASEGQLAANLLTRLLAGINDQPTTKNSEKNLLSPKAIAEFLAHISRCPIDSLPREVKNGLRSLGIESPKAGRPRGKKAAAKYARYVEVLREAIDETGVFSERAKMKREHGGKWRIRFNQFLQQQKWPADIIPLVATTRAPQTLAMHIAADIFRCEYNAVYRACRIAVKSVKK